MCCYHDGPSQSQSDVVHQHPSLSSKTENQSESQVNHYRQFFYSKANMVQAHCHAQGRLPSSAFPLRDVLDWPRLAQSPIHPSRTETTDTWLGSPSPGISLLLILKLQSKYHCHCSIWFSIIFRGRVGLVYLNLLVREPLLILFLPRAFSFSSRISTKSFVCYFFQTLS